MDPETEVNNVETPATSSTTGTSTGPRWKMRFAILVVLLLAIGLIYWQVRDVLSLDYLAKQETSLRDYQEQMPWIVAAIALAIYVAMAGLSLPGATPLTLVYGWYFGFWKGLLIVSFGSTGGAVVAFLVSRYLLRDWVQQRMRERFERVNDAFEREGPFNLFALRLVPLVPFFVVNAVMGLTRINVFTFWWISQIGMLPATAAYVYAGSTVPSLQTLADKGVGQVLTPQLLAAFTILGLLPLAVKKIVKVLRSRREARHSE